MDERQQAPDDEGIGDGQTLRLGGRGQGRRGGDSDSRRVRLHERLSARKILARFQALHDRRGGERGSKAGDRTAVGGFVSVGGIVPMCNHLSFSILHLAINSFSCSSL